MNEWQLIKQVVSDLESAVWVADSRVGTVTGTLVWGNNVRVIASTTEVELALASTTIPCALIIPGTGGIDPAHGEDSGLFRYNFTIVLVANVPSNLTEDALMGAGRPSEIGSQGMGLLEIQKQLFDTMQYLGVDQGIELELRAFDVAQAVPVQSMGHLAYREYGYETHVTTDPSYPPCRSLSATYSTSNTVIVSWSLPAPRFDRYRAILRRSNTTTPPTSITDGTGITLASALATSVTDATIPTGATDVSYALFFTYDERSSTPDSDDKVSESVTATVTIP